MTSEYPIVQQPIAEHQPRSEQKNRQIMDALSSSLSGGLKLADYKQGTSPFVDGFMDFFSTAQHDADIVSDSNKISQITKLGTLLLDSVLIDELAKDSGVPLLKGKALYGRSEAEVLIRDFPVVDEFIKSSEEQNRHFRANIFTQEEMQEWDKQSNEMYTNNDSFSKFDTLDRYLEERNTKYLGEKHAYAYISTPLTLEQFLKEKDVLFSQNLPDTFGLEFYIRVGKYFFKVISYQEANNFGLTFPPESPDQTVPRVELWNAYIDEGYPIFDEEKNPGEPPNAASLQDAQPIAWDIQMQRLIQLYGQDEQLPGIINRRKYAHFLSHQVDLESYSDGLRNHIGKEFARTPDEKPMVRITRSGSSANLLGCYIAADMVGGELGFSSQRAACYVDPDFYYENDYLLNEANFEIVNSFDEANIFALSADINTPRESQNEFQKRRRETIQKIVEKARVSPDKTFSIVYDKTADPDSNLFDQISDIPSNLKTVESISFSKFQRGGRNAFYGAVLYEQEVDPKKLDIFERQSLAAPAEYNIVTFPHITKGDIKKIIDRNSQVFRQVQTEYAKPENAEKLQGWKIIEANFYFFLVPPEKFWQENGSIALAISTHSVDKARSTGMVEVGDSYGTTNPRLSVFVVGDTMGEFPSQKFIPAVRVSYGLTPTIEKISAMVNGIVGSYKEVDQALEEAMK